MFFGPEGPVLQQVTAGLERLAGLESLACVESLGGLDAFPGSGSVAGLLIIASVILFAYTVVGTTGFGASIIAVPLIVHLQPLTVVVPMMVVFDACAGALLGGRNFASIDRRELFRLLPFMLAGIVLGVTLLLNIPERPLLLTLGISVLCYAAWSLWGRPPTSPIAPFWSAPLGAAGGVFSALFGTGGPIYTIYLARRIEDKSRLRATISTLILISAVARLGTLIVAGAYAQGGLIPMVLLVLPCMLAGLYLGNRLHHRLPGRQVIKAVWALLMVSSLSLLWRNA